MTKMTFNPIATTAIATRMNVGTADVSAIRAGFLVVGRSAQGSDVIKPVSKKAFIEQFGDGYESKSQAVKAFYQNLGRFTDAAAADFGANVRKGMRVSQVRATKGGVRHYAMSLPKADTAGSEAVNGRLATENETLKRQLAAMQAQLAKLTEAISAE